MRILMKRHRDGLARAPASNQAKQTPRIGGVMPWNPAQIISHVERLGLPRAGVDYVRQALAAPSRHVGRSRFLAVSARFASEKLGQVVQAESHTSELPFVHHLELDDAVIAFLDQPPPLSAESIDRRGRRHRSLKTPDFLVIGLTEVSLYECKTHSELERLVVDQPNNWIHSGNGYRYLPLELPSAELGMRFTIHDAGLIGQIYAANLNVLVNVKRNSIAPLDNSTLLKAVRRLDEHNGLTLSHLAEELRLKSVSQILASIFQKQLHALLHWQLLTMPESTMVYGTKDHLGAAEMALKEAAQFDCLRARNYQVPLALSKAAFDKAIESLQRIKLIRSGELRPTRTDYRRMRALRSGESSGVIPLLAVAPAYHRRGARKALPEAVEEIIRREIQTQHATSVKSSVIALHRDISIELRKAGYSPICFETVRQRVRAISRAALAGAREGYRAANAARPPIAVSDRALRAQYAWEKAHVDATVLDEKIWLTSALGNILARPTVYLLIDEATSFILAYWISFDSAGDQAVACLFRDCIRRHEKLPCKIMHDQGSEYFSTFAETFSASTGIDLLRRPSAAPRWGSHVESGFKRINELLIHQLPGNTQNDRLGRSSTASVRSEAHARQKLLAFLELTEEALTRWLNDRPVGENFATPRQNFDESEQTFIGLAKTVRKSPEVLVNTAIPVTQGRRIDHARGIKYMHRHYDAPRIRDPLLHGKKVQIRWEPYNPYIIYAHVLNEWIRLTCRGYSEIENTPFIRRLTELYVRTSAYGASKAARQLADSVIAGRIKLEFSAPGQPELVADLESTAPDMDLFELARIRSLGEHIGDVP